MATQLQLRRGTTVENDGFTGALAEVTVDTDTHELRVHDGSTQGGFVIPTESDMNAALGDKADVSDVYDKATVDTALNAKAETDLGNITDGAKNVASWSSNVTNCITEIPQDIKLELDNGTLTLKAGSKVYVPNGDGIFDEVVISNDINWKPSGGTAEQLVVMYNNSSGEIVYRYISESFSGSTAPTSKTNEVWYDTTNNLVKYTNNSGSSWTSGGSLPICLVTANSDKDVISIDQVFNGLGYIGSTVFALPGVKGLIPNGRNADGSLKNTTTNDLTTVKTVQVNTSTAKIAMYSAGGLGSQTKNLGLNEQENFNYDTGVLTNALEIARVIVDSNAKITAFTPKTAFHAVDYSDSEYIAHCAMPSDKYIDITVGASDASYTAPADGLVYFGAGSSASGQRVLVYREGLLLGNGEWSSAASQGLKAILPVKKGDIFHVIYTAPDNKTLQFYYANGVS